MNYIKNKKNNKHIMNAKGNMTLEAAIIVPITMLIILLMVKTGVNLHTKNKDKSMEYVQSIEASVNLIGEKRKSLYKYKLIKDEVEAFKD